MLSSNYIAKDAHIVVVGGNSAIGQSAIASLLEYGSTVYSIDIDQVSKLSAQNHFHYFQCNPVNAEALSNIAMEIMNITPKISGLVCLSGIMKYFKPILEQSEEEWQEVFDISFKSCFNACKIFSPLFDENLGGAIVNMSSGLALLGNKNYGPYSNSKAAIISLSKTLASELAPKIRVNSIAPGAVATPFLSDEHGATRMDVDAYIKRVPLERIATPKDVSQLIIFLLSDAASYITGQCIHINGGALMV